MCTNEKLTISVISLTPRRFSSETFALFSRFLTGRLRLKKSWCKFSFFCVDVFRPPRSWGSGSSRRNCCRGEERPKVREFIVARKLNCHILKLTQLRVFPPRRGGGGLRKTPPTTLFPSPHSSSSSPHSNSPSLLPLSLSLWVLECLLPILETV